MWASGKKVVGGAAGGTFVDRGDPAAVDFNAGSLTEDSAWHDLDLSSIVPVGAKAVLLRVGIAHGESIAKTFYIRENGNSNMGNVFTILTNVVGTWIYGDCIVALDSNRKAEYKFDSGGTWYSAVTVGGWWT
jgi:hypothetical protein